MLLPLTIKYWQSLAANFWDRHLLILFSTFQEAPAQTVTYYSQPPPGSVVTAGSQQQYAPMMSAVPVFQPMGVPFMVGVPANQPIAVHAAPVNQPMSAPAVGQSAGVLIAGGDNSRALNEAQASSQNTDEPG